jgi:hypothetical protein
MITREYTGNYRNDNDQESDERACRWGKAKEQEGEGEGEEEEEDGAGRSVAIGIINDRNRTKMRTGRVRRRR